MSLKKQGKASVDLFDGIFPSLCLMSDLRTTFLGGDVVLGLDGGENCAVSVPAWKFSSTSIFLESSFQHVLVIGSSS